MERLASSKIMKQKSSGSRGIGLEKLINHTIEYYREKNLALIQKIPTPIIPMKYSKDKKLISLARFDKKSTVDYIGVVQEVAVCFDAKECEQNRFPLKNIHAHQYKFMTDFDAQGGVSFLIINLKKEEKFYYMRYKELKAFWNRGIKGEIMSIKSDELDNNYFFDIKPNGILPILDMISRDLGER
jgi:recombination protein U